MKLDIPSYAKDRDKAEALFIAEIRNNVSLITFMVLMNIALITTYSIAASIIFAIGFVLLPILCAISTFVSTFYYSAIMTLIKNCDKSLETDKDLNEISYNETRDIIWTIISSFINDKFMYISINISMWTNILIVAYMIFGCIKYCNVFAIMWAIIIILINGFFMIMNMVFTKDTVKDYENFKTKWGFKDE